MNEYKAKTVEDAIELGLKDLGIERSEAEIEIVNNPGLFKKATVIVKKKVTEKEEDLQSNTTENCNISTNEVERENKENNTTNNSENTQSICDNNANCNKKSIHENDKPVVDFLTDILTKMGLSFSLDIKSNKDILSITVKGNDSNYVIGYRGETLDNLQFLCLLVANKNTRFKKKLVLDAEGYRELRTETLTALSKKLAYKVARTNTAIELEPMNPFERRVIHTALQDDKYVTTASEGEEPNRYVVISPIKKEKNMYDNKVSHNFKKSGIKTRSFGQKQKRF